PIHQIFARTAFKQAGPPLYLYYTVARLPTPVSRSQVARVAQRPGNLTDPRNISYSNIYAALRTCYRK
ncbi:MAG: hypothetical protein ACREWG_10985, partial [Gammaproteobacteria bacterium]